MTAPSMQQAVLCMSVASAPICMKKKLALSAKCPSLSSSSMSSLSINDVIILSRRIWTRTPISDCWPVLAHQAQKLCIRIYAFMHKQHTQSMQQELINILLQKTNCFFPSHLSADVGLPPKKKAEGWWRWCEQSNQ